MTWLVLVAAVLASPSVTGQMANPLRAYGTDHREYLITFAGGGIEFEGRSFAALGGNRFHYEGDAPGCDTPEPQRVDTVLRFVEQGVEIKTNEVFVTCAGTTSKAQYTRRLSVFKPQGEPTCAAGTRNFNHGATRLSVDVRCDGTLVLAADGAPTMRLTERRPRHFAGAVGRFKATVTFTDADVIRVRLAGPGSVIEGSFGPDLR